MEYCRPDYDNCIVNLSNSILKAFGAETSAPTLKMADKLLEKEYKNVVGLLMDAMGISILQEHIVPFSRPRQLQQRLRCSQAFIRMNTDGSGGICIILNWIRM